MIGIVICKIGFVICIQWVNYNNQKVNIKYIDLYVLNVEIGYKI